MKTKYIGLKIITLKLYVIARFLATPAESECFIYNVFLNLGNYYLFISGDKGYF